MSSDLLEVIFCNALHFLALNSLSVGFAHSGWTWVFSLSLSLSLSLLLLFPPLLLGALFNGVCQGFITFHGFVFSSFFFFFLSKEQLLFGWFKAFVDKISRTSVAPGLGFRV
jgi:hypothetical protein